MLDFGVSFPSVDHLQKPMKQDNDQKEAAEPYQTVVVAAANIPAVVDGALPVLVAVDKVVVQVESENPNKVDVDKLDVEDTSEVASFHYSHQDNPIAAVADEAGTALATRTDTLVVTEKLDNSVAEVLVEAVEQGSPGMVVSLHVGNNSEGNEPAWEVAAPLAAVAAENDTDILVVAGEVSVDLLAL